MDNSHRISKKFVRHLHLCRKLQDPRVQHILFAAPLASVGTRVVRLLDA
jgi:hypothetical protein